MTREEVNQSLNKLCEYGGMMLDWQYVEAIRIAAIFYETGEDTATKENKPVGAILDDMKSIVDRMIDDGLKMIEKRRAEEKKHDKEATPTNATL